MDILKISMLIVIYFELFVKITSISVVEEEIDPLWSELAGVTAPKCWFKNSSDFYHSIERVRNSLFICSY